MTRTSPNEVEQIIEFDSLTTSEIQEFIDDANTIVTEKLAGHASDALLPIIEKWLSAHLAAMKEQRVQESSVGKSEIVYEGDAEMGLQRTRYGQQAMAIDDSGLLGATTSDNHYSTSNHSTSDFVPLEEGRDQVTD